MPRRAAPPAAPAHALGELNAALDALNLNLSSGFGRPCDRPAGLGTAPTWSPREEPFHDRMRKHLDAINRQLVTTGDDVDHLDETLARAISDHLTAIGLDDLTLTPPHN